MNVFCHMKKSFRPIYIVNAITLMSASLLLSACGDRSWWEDEEKQFSIEQIRKVIPSRVSERDLWAKDIYDITEQLGIPQNKENVCTIIAVVDQESNFVANPSVPGLGKKAVKEVQDRFDEKFKDKLGEGIGGTVASYFQDVLKNQPTPEDNYLKQMAKVSTEKELDELYREIFAYMSKHYHVSALTGAAKLVGQDIGEKLNPITTLGSMQVHISYAKDHKYKSGNIAELRTDMYTRYGGLYYGIHRLMMYPADYDKPIYRFADYNSGRYSSRNAAFQSKINMINKSNSLDQTKLSLDGDLLLYGKNGNPKPEKSSSEQALINLFAERNVLITPKQIRSDLKDEKDGNFENSQTYKVVTELFVKDTGKKDFYAIMPEVVISGPKLSRDYNTNWFATRVNGRYQTCMQKAQRIKI